MSGVGGGGARAAGAGVTQDRLRTVARPAHLGVQHDLQVRPQRVAQEEQQRRQLLRGLGERVQDGLGQGWKEKG